MPRSINEVTWIPPWEETGSRMIENRPDWCVSGKGPGGFPLPSFTVLTATNLVTQRTVDHIVTFLRRKGRMSGLPRMPISSCRKGFNVACVAGRGLRRRRTFWMSGLTRESPMQPSWRNGPSLSFRRVSTWRGVINTGDGSTARS
jgi:hypothetical protein